MLRSQVNSEKDKSNDQKKANTDLLIELEAKKDLFQTRCREEDHLRLELSK
jgi:hypothetical protein